MRKYKSFVLFIIFTLLIIFYILCIFHHHHSNRKNMIQSLLRQTSRWAVASQQDKSPMVAVLHANYAVGFLGALETIATPSDLTRLVDFDLFKNKILHIQDHAVRKAVKACPQYLGPELDKMLVLQSIPAPTDE